MCRLVGWVSDDARTLADVLGPVALDRLVRLSSFHGDGWGIAFRDSGGIRVHKSLRAARHDHAFATMASELRSTAAIVHLRWATPGLGRNLADTHPFTAGAYVMAHNGAIGPVDRLDALLVPEAIERPQGTTDSEHLLYGVTASLADNDNDLVAALESTSARGADAGLRAASLNSMFLGPDGLHVVNWHDPSGVPEAAARSNADDPSNPPYFDLRHRGTRGLDVVVSSGFVPDASSWTLLAPASVTHISAPGHSATRRLQPELSMCPLEPHVAQNSRQAVPGSIR